MRELRPVTVKEFFNAPRAGGASTFAEDFRNIAITDVAMTGHRFRLFGNDPTALRVEEERRGGPVPEKINFTVDYLPAVFLAVGAERSRAVALIEADGMDFEGKRGRWSGTGFLVHANLLLTNYHVLNSVEVAKSARVIFNFQLGPDHKPAETVAFKLDPDRLFVTSPLHGGLDYAFVWIDGAAARQFGTIALLRSAFTVQVGDRANIIQHPRGQRKQIVLQNNEVLRDTGLVLHYASDTDIGSSGSPVFDNRWHLIALHHAADRNRDGLKVAEDRPPPTYLNEGIKISAIAADLERRVAAGAEGDGPAVALAAFTGIDSLMGYFGGLGRRAERGAGSGARPSSAIEEVVDIYSGENRDLDVAFWNVEWFTEGYAERLARMAVILADFNLDIWVLSEMTAAAAAALSQQIRQDLGLDFGHATTAAEAGDAEQRTTAVLWNRATVAGGRRDWPAGVEPWFSVETQQFADLRLATVPGPVFDHAPGLFHFDMCNRREAGLAPVGINLVSLTVGHAGTGRQRRQMAARIVAAAIAASRDDGGDWLIGGLYDGEAANAILAAELGADMAAQSAATASGGAITYLRGASSLTQRLLLSPNLKHSYGAGDLLAVATAQRFPDYLEALSPTLPHLVRVCFADQPAPAPPPPPSLLTALARS